MPPNPLDPQIGPPQQGRRYSGRRKVRLGDVTPSGRLRLDALTRYTQDVSDDDTTAAGLAPEPAWVVRRTVVDVVAPARLAEPITITTFCSGLGRRWAERRLQVRGEEGGRYEVATLWICVDATSGQPQPLTEQFLDLYGSAAGGRTVSARLTNPKPSPSPVMTDWPLRAVDFDTLGHVNNAAYWAVVEEVLASEPGPNPSRITLEYSAGLDRGDTVTIASAVVDDSRVLWWLTDGEREVAASASITPLSDGLYQP